MEREFGPNFLPAPQVTFDSFKALLFGDTTVTPNLPSLRQLKQALSDAATVERKKVGALSVLLARVETDAQDWYAEATSVFAEGTEIGNLIRTIPTTYTPPAKPATPKPATETGGAK